ncbi:MAG: type II secretion system F family protein [Planctomycetota bacterium]|jgi:type IV pilus assembly protein PilC
MKGYQYIARDSSGQRKEGVKEATSSNEVLAYLREEGLTPVSISEIATSSRKSRRTQRRRRIKSADLAALCWQLTTMVEGGIPITTALETIAEDIENSDLRKILLEVLHKMEKGETFSDSISEYPKVFNRLSCALILAGEVGGTLPTSLRRLAEYYDNRDKLSKKVKGAMAYPIFVITFILLILIFIMTFIIPRFRVIFDQLGGELPAFTQAFMGIYDGIRNNMIYIIGTSLFLVISCVLVYRKTRKGHYFFSKIFLVFPLLGSLFRQAFIATFCRTMSTLISAGVSVLEGLDILAEMPNNDIIRSAITKTREHIVQGSNISLSLATAGFFPGLVIKMVQVGEESGSLPNVLDRTASYYERKVDTTITSLMSLIEPVMIVTIGAIVLVVVLALYLPIFSMSDMAR